jgi:hypothetical protein
VETTALAGVHAGVYSIGNRPTGDSEEAFDLMEGWRRSAFAAVQKPVAMPMPPRNSRNAVAKNADGIASADRDIPSAAAIS